jgi:hypothetical protein
MARHKKKVIEVATPPILVVQRITTEWTQRSRGGEEARVRNAVAETFEFPLLPDAEKMGVMTHEVLAREDNNFIPETVKPRVQASALELVHLLSLVHGEPLTVNEGEWVQFLSNRAFISSYSYKKMYYKRVTNIGRFVRSTGHEFLTLSPKYVIDRRQVLR